MAQKFLSIALLTLTLIPLPILAATCPTQGRICTFSSANSPPANCGTNGGLDKPSVLLAACTSSLATCTLLCGSKDDCKSFSYKTGGSSNQCTLYSASLTEQGFQRNNNAKVKYFGRACYEYGFCPPLSQGFTLSTDSRAGGLGTGPSYLISYPVDDVFGSAVFTKAPDQAAVFALEGTQLTTDAAGSTIIANVDRDVGDNSYVYFNTLEDIEAAGAQVQILECQLRKQKLACQVPASNSFCVADTVDGTQKALRLSNGTCAGVTLSGSRATL